MDLMAAHREQIDPHTLRIDPVLSVSLYGVHMVYGLRVPVMYQLSRCLHRHNRSHLIIHIHGGYQDRIRADCCLQFFQGQISSLIHRNDRDLIPLFLQPFQRGRDCRVLKGCGNDVLSLPAVGIRSTHKGPVVRFCSTGGEENLFLLYFQGFGNCGGCFLHIPFRFHAF